ncbi:hypothetical protein, conserved [Trypanosoma brucei gambiense DAL972]|uniref:SKP1 component POZ domain-containing protein n=1 Tax=Trypanosoma brucei gambiense (strain MHOM/CI/86/DAL972) TaxID=679716 RepID=D0A9L9_TRYB9|nr:hypothetical protein, conserved [Trypanosoma brucei gambiense DAL972]CBH18370.1 hypothetical protein, conserved [Trypanosoma brucei gambiense DAL972]|eukprot:XP_011780634.1 hypothetical protein, conserved [Trypanosoma brucei gambiense DAL972]
MAACDVTLVSPNGETVSIPAASAWNHIGLLQRLAELDESGCTEMPEIELGFSTEVLRAVADYLEKSSRFVIDARRPLTGSLRDFVPEWNLDFVRGAERREILMPLFECACFLCVVELRELLGAYVAERVNEIAREAPSIMEGAARLRTYLQLENEWTEEETEHLEQEMRYAKQVDPFAY